MKDITPAMTFPIALPDSLRPFLEEEMREQGHASLDACAAFLLQQRQRLKPRRRTFNVRGQAYRLTRLTDYQDYRLRECSIAIEEDFELEYEIARSADRLTLAETYAVCRDLFGERGDGFDDWKGGFAFPFALDVPRAARRPAYLFHVVNFRGRAEFRLRRLVDANDERLKNPIYYPPDADEFSREEISGFVRYFVGFLEGYCESLASRWTDRFLLAVESNLILYGFDGDSFFTRQFQSPEDFAATRAKLAERLPTPGFYASDQDGW